MTNKVCIPVEIIRNSKLSPRARIIWAELSLLPRNPAGKFVVHQKELTILIIRAPKKVVQKPFTVKPNPIS